MYLRHLFLLCALLATQSVGAQTILVSPYMQPGGGSKLAGSDVGNIIWFTDQTPGEFSVEYEIPGMPPRVARPARSVMNFGMPKLKAKRAAAPASANPLADAPTTLDEVKREAAESTVAPRRDKEQHYFRYVADLTELPFDSRVTYRVKLGTQLIREATFKTRASAGATIRFAAVGDLATGKKEQNGIAWQMARQKPDFAIALGDIVYSAGRMSQYMDHFFSTYNDVAQPGPETGAPLMATMPIYPVIGNHDIDVHRLTEYPDAWGAFHVFRVPKNGPSPGRWMPSLGSNPANAANFRAISGDTFPSLLFYSWDCGPVHFTVLDCNGHINPLDPALLEWIERDLGETRQPWKIVCFHAPAFHASREHFTAQKMRFWQPLFERHGVDVVLSGHVHNYQRSKPLRFAPNGIRDPRGHVRGELRLDENFDGVKNTRPDGVIHVVSGGGGASLYSQDLEKTMKFLAREYGRDFIPFTAKYFAARHSFSLVEVSPTRFTLRQIDINGSEVDTFTITKPAPAIK